jgi:hypothetical protein
MQMASRKTFQSDNSCRISGTTSEPSCLLLSRKRQACCICFITGMNRARAQSVLHFNRSPWLGNKLLTNLYPACSYASRDYKILNQNH